MIGSYMPARQNLLQYAFAAIVFAPVGWLAATANYRRKLAHQQSMVDHMAAQIASKKAANALPEQKPSHAAQVIATYFVASRNPSLRGTGNPEEPVVTFAPGDSLVMLDLAVVEGEHGSYRATVSSFPEEKELLSENSLRPVKRDNDWVVEFALPSTLVADHTHYLVTLDSLDSQVRATSVSRFLFEVRK
jgi:hypothetical protein